MERDYVQGESVRLIRRRIANACDGCKRSKVKCDGKTPCGYCADRKGADTCRYSRSRRRRRSQPLQPCSPTAGGGGECEEKDQGKGKGLVGEDETEVPREARLLRDAHGKLTFIGDCAPLSFFQSVRRLLTTTKVGFAAHAGRFSVLENVPARYRSGRTMRETDELWFPPVRLMDVAPAVSSYACTTTSLVDLFDEGRLVDGLQGWARLTRKPNDAASRVYLLVLAIGMQDGDDGLSLSHKYFAYARDQAYASLGESSLGVETVQEFLLITVYMLCSCQINGAFVVFGIAVRAAYSIGLHRTEVNARFGAGAQRQRDRLWKSLRNVDLFLSSSMGRPPATSDVDCTVPYRTLGAAGNEEFDLLDASVQILLILETVVLEIYSRRKISLQLAEGFSSKLRVWSARWLHQLKGVLNAQQRGSWSEAQITGACQVLSSYYYAVMLVSRPFLMYELCRRLTEGKEQETAMPPTSERSKLADACVEAASLMVETILELIERNVLKGKMPLLVSWLFSSSLVLGVGLLQSFARTLEKYTTMSIKAMNHFAQTDAHARQYSLIAQSLLTTALEYLEKQEEEERLRRTETSSQLFGLDRSAVGLLSGTTAADAGCLPRQQEAAPRHEGRDLEVLEDVALLQMSDEDYWDGLAGSEWDGSALNLFPLLEAGGGIDLAHWFEGVERE